MEKIDHRKDSSKLEILTKDSLLFSKVTKSNLTDHKKGTFLSSNLKYNIM